MMMSRANFLGASLVSMALAIAPVVACLAADERQSLEELRNTVINLLQALVDQGVLTREKAEQMVKAAQDKAAADATALAKSEEGAVRVPYVPQIVQDQIAKQVEAQVKPDVVADVVKEAKEEKWGVPGALADWLTRTRISGEVTLREEGVLYPAGNVPNVYLNYFAINQAGGTTAAGVNAFEDVNVNNVRFRGRARLAVNSDITDSISAGVRLATGNTGDLVSETQTFDGTAPYSFGVDEAFIRLDERNSQRFSWLSAVIGRFEDPYFAPTNLLFHRDLTFDGLSATGRFGFGDGSADQSHVFLTLGAHPVQSIQLSAQDKWLAGGQLGGYFRWDGGQNLRLGAAFYDYVDVTGRLNPPGGSTIYNYTAPQFLRQGNTYFDINSSGVLGVNLFALAAKYRVANLNAAYFLPLGRYTMGVVLDAVRNVGYNNAAVAANVGHYVAPRVNGYQAELSFGDPTTLVAGAWRGAAGYRYLQRDAVIDAYTDSDFHWGGTDATGYYLVGDVGLAKRVWLRVRYMSSNAIDGVQLAIDTVQVDVNTRF
jgi:Putative porin